MLRAAPRSDCLQQLLYTLIIRLIYEMSLKLSLSLVEQPGLSVQYPRAACETVPFILRFSSATSAFSITLNSARAGTAGALQN